MFICPSRRRGHFWAIGMPTQKIAHTWKMSCQQTQFLICDAQVGDPWMLKLGPQKLCTGFVQRRMQTTTFLTLETHGTIIEQTLCNEHLFGFTLNDVSRHGIHNHCTTHTDKHELPIVCNRRVAQLLCCHMSGNCPCPI